MEVKHTPRARLGFNKHLGNTLYKSLKIKQGVCVLLCEGKKDNFLLILKKKQHFNHHFNQLIFLGKIF